MLKQRQSIRLKNYDYSQSGLYFVTICIQNRECLFGNVLNGKMVLNDIGNMIEKLWNRIPERFNMVELDAFQIMQDHIHFILMNMGASRRAPTTLGFIVGMFKTECTKQINKLRNTPGQKIFQRNYYEHIIRTENDLNKIREYIKLNPLYHV